MRSNIGQLIKNVHIKEYNDNITFPPAYSDITFRIFYIIHYTWFNFYFVSYSETFCISNLIIIYIVLSILEFLLKIIIFSKSLCDIQKNTCLHYKLMQTGIELFLFFSLFVLFGLFNVAFIVRF